MFDSQYGLMNWALGRQGESWLAQPLSFFMVATLIVVWMGIPFIAFTVYAGLTQVPSSCTRRRSSTAPASSTASATSRSRR